MTPALLRLFALAACLALGSCASSTMDSIPDDAQLAEYKRQGQASLAQEYMALGDQRHAGQLTEAQYQAEMAKLEERAVSIGHSLAWQNHSMAEQQRKARGEPTPDAPVAIQVPNAMNGGASGGSLYRSGLQNYNMINGVGGAAGATAVPSLPASTLGGAMRRGNYPGSIYDEPGR